MARRDYASSEGHDEEDNVEYLKPHVLRTMVFEYTSTGNFRNSWMIDPSHGIERIADFVAYAVNDDETWWEMKALKRRRDDCGIADAECQWWRNQGQGFINCVWIAVRELIEEGVLDIAMEWGWPAIRVARVPSNDELGWLPGEALDRAERMRIRGAHLETMPYAEYLQSEEWRFRREIHLEAVGHRCQLCNSPERPLHVHHRTYANRGRERFYDLVVLCGPCHEAFHKTGRKIR